MNFIYLYNYKVNLKLRSVNLLTLKLLRSLKDDRALSLFFKFANSVRPGCHTVMKRVRARVDNNQREIAVFRSGCCF
jgi:hypothetical protein